MTTIETKEQSQYCRTLPGARFDAVPALEGYFRVE
jgi:hypothetical protein